MKIGQPDNTMKDMAAAFLLIGCILAVYYQAFFHDFIIYDTPEYVYENIHVTRGLNFENIIWAFSTTACSNWHPLTWISHMVDVELFGLNPGCHHAVNVMFHIINTLLLYRIIRKLSGSLWSSFFIAGLFAVHPLHIQTVAWVAERKDLLSTMMGFIAVLFYCRYIEQKERDFYLLVILFFMLSLLAKPMLVTLPFVLMLMDFWPLDRYTTAHTGSGNAGLAAIIRAHASLNLNLVTEKIPLLFLSVASCVITTYVQRGGGAVISLGLIPLDVRLLNVLSSYGRYIFFMFYPLKLAVIYPFPRIIHLSSLALSTAILACMTIISLRSLGKRSWIAVGWFFFAGTLVPVIGFVQVGMQAMADRYTYVPLIGLFVVICGFLDLLYKKLHKIYKKLHKKNGYVEKLRWISTFALLSALMIISWNQLRYWRDSIFLFSRAIEVTEDNFIAYANLGYAFLDKNRSEEASTNFLDAIKINPDFEMAHYGYAITLAEKGDTAGAIKHYEKTLQIRPDYTPAHINLGNLYYRMENYSEALNHYLKAYEIQKDNVGALNGIGAVMVKRGFFEKGVYFFRKSLEIDPGNIEAEKNLEKILAVMKSGK